MGFVPLLESVKDVVRRSLVRRAGGIDLTQIHRVPDRLSWPLDRTVTDPSDAGRRAARGRAGLEADHVPRDGHLAGHRRREAREVLGDLTSYSTDIRPYYGKSGAADGDIGGLGFTDPPEHTRLRKLLTPEFTMRRLARLKPAIDRIIEQQLDETEQVAAAQRRRRRPRPDLRLPGPVPGDLRAAGPAARRTARTSAASPPRASTSPPAAARSWARSGPPASSCSPSAPGSASSPAPA